MRLKNAYGFIPRNLEVEGRPELAKFPLNVLFSQHWVQARQVVSGLALYEPDLESYTCEGDAGLMKYRNVNGGESWVLITFDEAKGIYSGEKWVSGSLVGVKSDTDRNRFFGEFTGLLGVTDGEACETKVLGPAARHQPSAE